MNPAAPTCPRCHSELTLTAGGWVCSACALENALGTTDNIEDAPGNEPGFPRPFGGFELLGQVGSGGMGLVFKARQTSLARIVALKVLVDGTFGDTAGRKRFHAEAEAAARLQHPNIVTVLEVGDVDGVPYLTMDLVDGPDLARLCNGRPLPSELAARILRDVTEAMKAAHAAGVIHRDLKPSNVLVGSDGRPRVTDFGLAKCRDRGTELSLTTAGRALGSPSYAAPEQAAGRRDEISARSDVYGLGALLYHLLTGRAPFVAATPLQTLRLVLEAEVVPPHALNPGIPRDLETICLRCLQKEPNNRYPSADALGADLTRFLEQRPILAQPPSLLYRGAKFVRRYRLGVAATASVILALATGLGLALAGFQRATRQQRAADAARLEAERLNQLVVQDLQPVLEQYGKLSVLKKTAEQISAYYARLPENLRTDKTDEEQAAILELIAQLRGRSQSDTAGGVAALEAARALRERHARAHPDEPEDAAAVLWNRTLYAWVAGDRGAFVSERHNRHLLEQWRALAARFPANYSVELGLGRALTDYSVGASTEGKLAEALAAATEARDLLEKHRAAHPDDARLRDLTEWNTWMVSASLQATGNPGEAIEAEQRMLAQLERRLADDPGNLSLRYLVAQAARSLSYRLTDHRMRDAELLAREHYRILVTQDPENRLYRLGFAMAHMMEAFHFFGIEGRIRPAREAMARHAALLEPFARDTGIEEAPRELVRCHETLALWAAIDGDPEDAHRHLAALRESAGPGGPADALLMRLKWREAAAWVAWHGRDWTGLTANADSGLAEIRTGLQQTPNNRDIEAFRVLMQAWRGIALQQQGRSAEARSQLEPLVTNPFAQPAAPYGRDGDPGHLSRQALDTLAEALARTGNAAAARNIAEIRLAYERRKSTEAPQFWFAREQYARASALMASLLDPSDPAEAPRRDECLTIATTLLQCPEAEGRLTSIGRAVLERVRELRVAEAAAGPRAR